MGANIDITDQRQLEDNFRAAQRLETIGQLAAGISHNFNNLLATMLPAIELAKRSTEGELQAALIEAATAGRRAADLVRQVTTWSSEDRAKVSVVRDADELVQRVVGMCRRFFESHFELTVSTTSSAAVCGHIAELEQAVMNLIVNARDALRDANIGRPRIDVFCELAAADRLRIRVVDNGPGIGAEVKARIFEPFFTTKPVGRGTGLGLSTVLATIQRHGGSVRCESKMGEGATFEVLLPVGPQEPGVTPQPSLAEGAGEVVMVGG